MYEVLLMVVVRQEVWVQGSESNVAVEKSSGSVLLKCKGTKLDRETE